jgi:hypothetical protein
MSRPPTASDARVDSSIRSGIHLNGVYQPSTRLRSFRGHQKLVPSSDDLHENIVWAFSQQNHEIWLSSEWENPGLAPFFIHFSLHETLVQ